MNRLLLGWAFVAFLCEAVQIRTGFLWTMTL